jgi:hypothetical protein
MGIGSLHTDGLAEVRDIVGQLAVVKRRVERLHCQSWAMYAEGRGGEDAFGTWSP